MQAIQVKYLPATNFRGARVKAISEAYSITQPFNYQLADFENACEAAYSLALKLNWNVKLKGGSLPTGGECFVIVDTDCTLTVS